MKKLALAAAAIILLGGAFWGGTIYVGSTTEITTTRDGVAARDGAFAGGPAGNMSEENRTALMDMTDEERQAFMQEQGAEMGDMPAGGGVRGARGGLMEGEVLDVADDSATIALADGGSQIVYTHDETVIAYAEGADGLSVGSQVMLYSEYEADGVQTASLIVVK